VLNGEAEAALRELNALARHGKDLGRLLSDLLGHFRNLLIFQVSKGDLKLLEVSETEAASLREQATLCSGETLTRLMEVLTDAEGRLRDAASKKIFIEVALLKAIEARNAVSIDTVLKQLQQLRGTDGGASASPAPVRNQPTVVTTSAAAGRTASQRTSGPDLATTVSAVTAGDTDLMPLWQAVLDAVGRASPFTRGYLVEAHPVSLAQNVLTIGFDPEFSDHMDLVNNQKTHAILQTKLAELGHANTQIKFVKAETPAGWAESNTATSATTPVQASPVVKTPPAPATTGPKKDKPVPVPINLEDFKNDPLIQQALEIFKGRIVEVRA
jgi:DNA polymerase-3 subunit gamma/tau